MNQEIADILERQLTYAQTQADQAELVVTRSSSFSTSSFNQKTDKLSINQGQSVGVRIIKNGRVGISYSEDFNEASIRFAVEQACANSKYMKEEPHERIQPSTFVSTEPLDKNQLKRVSSTQEKVDLSIQLEKEILSMDPLIKSAPYNGVSESTHEYYNFTTEGLRVFECGGSVSCYTSCLMEEGTQNGMHYESSVARDLSDLDVQYVLQESYAKAKQLFLAQTIASGDYDVIFTTDVLSQLFSTFGRIFSGKISAENKNPLFSKLGENIFDARLTLIDDPAFAPAFSHHIFDCEGFAQSPVTLIGQGKYLNLFHNSKTASELSMENNFRASRGTRGPLGTSSTNKVIVASDHVSEAELHSTSFVEIFALQGVHSGADAVSGDFSFGASGILHDGGTQTPIKGFTISGNFYAMLNNIDSFGDVQHASTGRSFFSPKVKFSGLHISGV